jgi:hypothetical protein
MIALLYIPILIYFAHVNAQWIKQGKHVKHFWNWLMHCIVALIVWAVTKEYYPNIHPVRSGIAVFPLSKVVFDTSLNLFRGLSFDYISPEVKQYTGLRMAIQKGKVMDYVEWKIFKNGILSKIVYLAITIFLII